MLRTLRGTLATATKAQEFGVKRYIEVSTAFVYKSQAKTPASESAELQPWTLQAKFKLEAEEAIRQLAGLDAVFVRPAVVRCFLVGGCTYVCEMRADEIVASGRCTDRRMSRA